MKTKELMIGDWVHCAKLDYAPENYVANMQVKQLYVADLDTYSFKELKYDEIEPIPLTEEILKKNGFKEYVYASLHTFYYDKKPIVSLFGNLGFSIDINRHNIKIHYVHELQHALRLCKIDKEIEL